MTGPGLGDADTVSGSRTPGLLDTIAVEGASEPRPLERGEAIGRYVVLDLLGRGGMGAVYAAFDPDLDRKVAIKILLPGVGGSGSTGQQRLLREAQSLARLSHHNVVTVHDVGTVASQVYIAMEHLDGVTLRAWLESEKRSHDEVVAAFVDAGRGLAAAHAEGLVHRDFKPDNVMVSPPKVAGTRPRVVVMDFGLARVKEAPASDLGTADAEIVAASGSFADGPTNLTEDGSFVGTPAYMSPEQFAGSSTDARTDQFSFCVSLWEALHGEHPFDSRSFTALAASVTKGEVRTPSRSSTVPAELRKIVERGLARSIDERWPDMSALLDALTGLQRRRRQRLQLAVAGVVTVGSVWLIVQDAREPKPCQEGARMLADVWDAERRAEVEAALLRTELPYANDVAPRVGDGLATYAREWVASFDDACAATRIARTQPAAEMELRHACLRSARDHLRATLDVLVDADESTVESADELLLYLPTLSACSDVDRIDADLAPPPPAEREAVEAVDARIARGDAQTHAGRIAEAEQALKEAIELAEPLTYQPVHARVAFSHGVWLAESGDVDAAVAEFRRAQGIAARQGQWSMVADALVAELEFLARDPRQVEHALAISELAAGLAEQSGRASLERMVVFGQITALLAAGRYDEASAMMETVSSTEDVGAVEFELRLQAGQVAFRQGQFEQAQELIEGVLADMVAYLGEEHPEIAIARNNLAVVFARMGQLDRAQQEVEKAIAIYQATLGEGHAKVAETQVTLAGIMQSAGHDEEARTVLELALAQQVDKLGEDHPKVAVTHNNLGGVYSALEEYEKAEASHRAALRIRETAFGPQHPVTAQSHSNLATLFWQEGKREASIASHRKALAIRVETLPADHPDLARTRYNLGVALNGTQHYAEAAELLALAWEVRRADHSPKVRARTAHELAVAWAPDPATRERARALTDQIRADYEAAGLSADDRLLQELDELVAELASDPS